MFAVGLIAGITAGVVIGFIIGAMMEGKAKLTHLPCQIGDEFYCVDTEGNKDYFKFRRVVVNSIAYDKNGIFVWSMRADGGGSGGLIEIGKTAFKTKKELIEAQLEVGE